MIYQNNGFKENLVCIPGWATDYKVFGKKFLAQFEYNFIFPKLEDLEKPKILIEKIKDFVGSEKVNLLGWSMGAFLAVNYAKKYGCKKLFLYGIRQKYSAIEISNIKEFLKKNKEVYLAKFYEASGFKKPPYQNYFTEEFLISGLDYLEAAQLDFDFLDKVEFVRITNSLDDKIAVFEEYPKNIPKNEKIEEKILKDKDHLCNIHK